MSDIISREFLLDCVPPCGLMCYTCPVFNKGVIKEHSAALLNLHEGYRDFMADRLPDNYRHVLDKYDVYFETLVRNANPSCGGCRQTDGRGSGCIHDCFIPECVIAHNVDFCAECAEFPCEKIDQSDIYDKNTKEGFLEGGNFIKAHGAEAFFQHKKNTPHYIKFKKE